MQSDTAVLAVIGLSAFLALGTPPEPAGGEENPNRVSVGPLAGVVVDAQGRAAAGAKVWLYSFHWQGEYRTPTVAETVTDGQGRFEFPKTEWDTQGQSQVTCLLARDAEGRLAPGPYVAQQRGAPDLTALRLTLQEVGVFRGRIVDLAGQPIPKATVRATIVNLPGEAGKTVRQLFIPDVLADETRTTTDDDGSFSLRGLPSQGAIQLKIAAAGFASPWALCNLQAAVTIQLARSGGLRGALLGMEEAQATGTITLFLSPDSDPQRLLPSDAAADDTAVTAFFSTTIETTADGTFECNEVPAGKYVLRLRSDANKPGEAWRFYAEDCPPFEVRPNELASVSLQLRPAIAVRGKVIDKKTEAGVPNVRVSLYVTSGAPGSPGSSVSATTDAQGEFVAYTRPGNARISIYDLPGNYIQDAQRGSAAQSQEISGPTELPAIEVIEAAGVEGIVVDDSGEPVADAEIYCLDDSHIGLREPVRSDSQGRFSLARLSPSATLPVKARTADSVAEQTVVKPSEMQEPLRLVVSKKNAFAIRGQVVDESGQPIGGAEATLASTWWIGGTGWGMSLGRCNSDGQGRFEFTGLWAGDRYQVKIASEGFGQYETPDLRGEAGRPHDLGSIVLRGAQGIVEGLVTDSAGRPLADVRVFNSGDGPQPVSARTDASGRFRLENLFQGPAWVFAEKPEYRFTAIRTQTGAQDATLLMLRTDESVPPRPTPHIAALREEQRKLAKELAEKLWAEGSADRKGQCISAMARLDLEQAQKWAAETDGKYGSTIRQAVVRRIAEEDPEEAIALLNADGSRAHYLLMQTAKRIADSDPAKAMRFAEEAVVSARALNQPTRTLALAE